MFGICDFVIDDQNCDISPSLYAVHCSDGWYAHRESPEMSTGPHATSEEALRELGYFPIGVFSISKFEQCLLESDIEVMGWRKVADRNRAARGIPTGQASLAIMLVGYQAMCERYPSQQAVRQVLDAEWTCWLAARFEW